jgi:hypothetical protein
MKELKFRPHSIIFLIGPSGCGKTHFAEKCLFPALSNYNVQHISSDEIHTELLGKDCHKYDKEMLHVSEQAFDVLLNRVKNLTSYPVNAEFIVIDTKGLYKDFRDQIREIAKENHYQVDVLIFAYKNREEYFQYLPENSEGWIHKMISRDIVKLNRETLRELNRRDYNNVQRLRDNNFSDVHIEIVKSDFYKKYTPLETDKTYRIVGDVHGCLLPLKKHYEEAKVNDEKLILIGDFIDKGPQTKEVVEFIYKHKDEIILVKGNHENFAYNWLEGKIEKEKISADILIHFDSIKLFEQDEKLKAKFYELFERSFEFVKHRDFIATHAPCKKKFLGKTDTASLRSQRNFIFPRRKEYSSDEDYRKSLEECFSFLEKESVFNQPYHVFGHISIQNKILASNKICVDNGCVHGRVLSSVTFKPNDPKPKFNYVSSHLNEQEIVQGLVPLLYPTSEKKVEQKFDLEFRDLRRINCLANNKINFISGTMCPADRQDNELESLEQALKYYKNKKVETIILQPKYMGSRCNIYLFNDPKKCYSTSRNGFVIQRDDLDLKPVYKKLIKQLKSKFTKENAKMILLDGELLPWSALGKELIEDQFKSIASALETETEFLNNNNFEGALEELHKKYQDIDYLHKMKDLGKKGFIEKYDHSLYRTLKSFDEFKRSSWDSITTEKEKIQRYQEQVQMYGESNGVIEFKPFMILKIVFQNGKEEIFLNESYKNTEIYPSISEDDHLILKLSDTKALDKAEVFYKTITVENKMEGIVIKPEFVYQEGIAPYMKVRNKEYLTIIYGYEYLSERKYEKLIHKKSIHKKLKTSIEEFKIGRDLLHVPYQDIRYENKDYFNACVHMIGEERVEKDIDPRL